MASSPAVEKVLCNRTFLFLCIDMYALEKEDSNKRNPSGVSFAFVQAPFCLSTHYVLKIVPKVPAAKA